MRHLERGVVIIFILVLSSFKTSGQDVSIILEGFSLDQKTYNARSASLTFQTNFYSSLFDLDKEKRFSARIFGKRKDFVRYAKDSANYNPNKTDAIAFYDPDLQEMVLHAEVNDLEATFAHELSHAIIGELNETVPLWLNEGMAELMETIVYENGNFNFGPYLTKNTINAKNYLSYGHKVEWALSTDDFYGNNISENYRLSWAVVHYLQEVNISILKNLIKTDYRNTLNPISLYYPGGFDALSGDVQAFFQNKFPIIE